MHPRVSFFLPIFCVWAAWIGLGAWAQDLSTDKKGIEINERGEPVLPAETPVSAAEYQASNGTMALLLKMEAAHKDVKTIHALFHQLTVDENFSDTNETDGEL